MAPPIVALFGPTAVGKTAVAIALARRLRAAGEDPVAVSADSMAVYRGLEILAAAPTSDEQRELEHRMVGIVAVTESFSVGRYMELAHAEIDAALAAGRRVIVVGGTGLYLRAALTRLDLRPPPHPEIRERLLARLAAEGPGALHAELTDRDPDVAATVPPADGKRIVRVLELLEAGERPPADRSEPNQLWTQETRHPTLLCGLVMDRDRLRARIDARTEAMLAAGVEAEVRSAAAEGPSDTALMAHGFRDLLAGDVEAMKRRTRQFTRRQLVWMRKLPDVHVLDVTGRDPDAVAADLHGMMLRDAGREVAGAGQRLPDRRAGAAPAGPDA